MSKFLRGVRVRLWVACVGLCATPVTSAVQPEPGVARSSTARAVELSFSDFYRMPVGPRGLEPTSTLLALNGQRVRVKGYMVHEDEPYPGLFLLAPLAVGLAERADGPADDLPASTLFVHLPADVAGKTVAFRPGPIAVEGVLELGRFEEINERMSYVRLRMDQALIAIPSTVRASAAS